MKFRLGGSGSEGAGIGWLGNRYFAKSGEIFETDDSTMIELLRKSNMAWEVPEEQIEMEVVQNDNIKDLESMTKQELVDICNSLGIKPMRAKEDMVKAIKQKESG